MANRNLPKDVTPEVANLCGKLVALLGDEDVAPRPTMLAIAPLAPAGGEEAIEVSSDESIMDSLGNAGRRRWLTADSCGRQHEAAGASMRLIYLESLVE